MNTETEHLTLLCCNCRIEVDAETEAYEFGGTVACEKCVREYENSKRPILEEMHGDDPQRIEASIELEVQTRRRNSLAWIKRDRKVLEAQAAKRRQRMDWL